MMTQKELLEKTSAEFIKFLRDNGLESCYRKWYNPSFGDTENGFNHPRNFIYYAFDWGECPLSDQALINLSNKWEEIVDNSGIKKDAHYIEEQYDLGEEDVESVEAVDMVNKPPHYELWEGTEAFDVIKSILTPEELKGYLKGNVLKYRLRAGKKGNTQQDIDKSNWYANEL